MTAHTKYRGTAGRGHVIGLSISYERDDLLARGLGLDHLREMLIRLARPLLRTGASIAFGGNWQEGEENFTYELLRLISAEQEDSSAEDAEHSPTIGRLINPLAWPHYLDVTPRIEAQWIRCCRIVRVSQELAGIPAATRVPDAAVIPDSNDVVLNSAIALSAMRKLQMSGLTTVSGPSTEVVQVAARVLLGGKTRGFSGFVPGIFEEALTTLQANKPLYILGGFGGAAGVLARTMLAPAGTSMPPELDVISLKAENPKLERLLTIATPSRLPAGTMGTAAALGELRKQIDKARGNLAQVLNTGLSDAETRELLQTRDMKRAVQLVVLGLKKTVGIDPRPS